MREETIQMVKARKGVRGREARTTWKAAAHYCNQHANLGVGLMNMKMSVGDPKAVRQTAYDQRLIHVRVHVRTWETTTIRGDSE